MGTGRGHRVDVRGLEADLKAKVDGEIRFGVGSRGLYTTDGSSYRQVPIGVVIPRSRDGVIEAVAVCREYGAPVLSRGCGTNLAGQCCDGAVAWETVRIDPGNRPCDDQFEQSFVILVD